MAATPSQHHTPHSQHPKTNPKPKATKSIRFQEKITSQPGAKTHYEDNDAFQRANVDGRGRWAERALLIVAWCQATRTRRGEGRQRAWGWHFAFLLNINIKATHYDGRRALSYGGNGDGQGRARELAWRQAMDEKRGRGGGRQGRWSAGGCPWLSIIDVVACCCRCFLLLQGPFSDFGSLQHWKNRSDLETLRETLGPRNIGKIVREVRWTSQQIFFRSHLTKFWDTLCR